MEDIIYVLVLVLSIVASIVQSANKKKKEKPRPQSPWDEEEPVEDIDEVRRDIKPAEERHFSYDTTASPQREEGIPPKHIPIPTADDTTITEEPIAESPVIDIDLKTAIIYSEILKPKFKEQ